MASEDWEGDGEALVTSGGHAPVNVPQPAELPEIKLFNKWSCDDVQVSDMSLNVSTTLRPSAGP
jgi:small subunit ribosomal protein S5e